MTNKTTLRPMAEQMPGMLAKMDDPWGITWRLVNFIKRFSLHRSLRLLSGLLRGINYERPVFVIGVPRSGTTMLFHLLRESPELGALPREGHDMWRTYHHPRYAGWRSDAVGRGQVKWGEARFINAYLYSYTVETKRFVEKTPENSLRIPYLLDLFPDALFVIIKRNPGDVINSLINGWRHPAGRYRSYFVPQDLHIPSYPHRRRWCFALIEGWRDYVSSPIPQIAFAQWEQCTKAISAARDMVPASRWLELHFEQLLIQPDETLLRICEAIDIQKSQILHEKLETLIAQPVNALSAPAIGKWRGQNEQEISQLLPQLASIAPEAGYRLDAERGQFEIIGSGKKSGGLF